MVRPLEFRGFGNYGLKAENTESVGAVLSCGSHSQAQPGQVAVSP
jgi:hypothetical protein